jgi:hypothetical protein
MGRKIIVDDEITKERPSNRTKGKPPLSSREEHKFVTTIAQAQELLIPRIFCSNVVSLPSTSPNIYDSLVSRAVVSNAQEAINTVTELSVLLMEPRSIEQMNVDPLVVDESFAWIFDTTEV